VLDGILDQARSTLLPDPNAWLGLERMLSAMLRLSTVTGTPSLLNKALDLQDDIREARRKRDEGLHQLAQLDLAQVSPRVAGKAGAERYKDYLAKIARQSAPMGVAA